MIFFIFVIAIFFSLNMGAPSFAGSFSTSVGSKALGKFKAQILFAIFAILGAITLGPAVSKTLSKGIIPGDLLTTKAALIILAAATLSLFVANLMHIPQSTSLSTIAAISGVGLFYHQVNWQKLQFLAVCWMGSVVFSFFLIYCAAKYVYPPRKANFWIYERIVHHVQRLRWIVNLTSVYKAFAQGSNNVANAVGPLVAAGVVSAGPGLIIMGAAFGVGAMMFSGPLKTSSEKIVPLGLLTATIINVVSGTLTIVASKMGIPFPTVIIYTAAIFAIGSIKDGVGLTLDNPVTRKTFFTWCINPVITFAVSYGLSSLFL